MANEYFWERHVLCFCKNRKGISQMYPEIENFVLFIHLLAKLGHLKSIAYIWLKQVIWEKAFLGFAHKNGYNSASNGSF